MADQVAVSQSASQDVLEGFVAELAAAGTSVALRGKIAISLQRWARSDGILFLERTADGNFACTVAIGATGRSLDGRGALARWLRVNNEMLVFRERPDVLAYLSDAEREYVVSSQCDAGVPLVAGDQLVALLLLCRVDDAAGLAHRRRFLESCGSRAAELWRQVTHTEQVQAHRDALGHSHRLGIAGQVAASVAHEVRNPLAAIRSLVQFAKDTPVSPEEHDSILGDVLAEVDRIDQTVTGMLQLSQPAVSRQRELDLSGIVHSVCRFVRAYASRHGVIVEVDADSDAHPIRVRGDEREVRQLLTNLLLNACQACSSGGQVRIVVRVIGLSAVKQAEVDISDTGDGISPEHLPRIFESFFTTKPQGTGLGLPYCREVVERHGGTIAVESAVCHGTRVRVTLPLLETHELTAGR